MSNGLVSLFIFYVGIAIFVAFGFWAKSRQDDGSSTHQSRKSMRNHKVSHK